MKKTVSFPAVFFGAFIHPRETTKEVIKNEYYSFILPLIVLYSLVAGLNPVLSFMMAKYVAFPMAYMTTFGLMFGFGLFTYFIGSWLTHWVGGKLEGKGSLEEVRAAYALAYMPMLVACLLKILLDLPSQLTLIYAASSLSDINVIDFVKAVNPLSGLVALIFCVWSIVTWTIALSEANRYSIGKSIKTSLLIVVIWFGVLIVFLVAIALICVLAAFFMGKVGH